MRLIISLICLISLIWLIPSPVLASTDPQSATPSATATIPVTTATTSDTLSPTTPILIRPPDNTYTSDNLPEFVWRTSSDPNGNFLTYTLYLDNTATYLGISNIGNSAGHGYTARLEGTEIKLLPTLALADGIHNWYVVATDISGNSSRSTTWRLTIDTIPPFILITEIDTYHDLSLDSRSPESVEDQSFDLHGPKNINFTVISKPYSTLTLQFFDADLSLVSLSSWPIDASGLAYPYAYLELGLYTVQASIVDTASLTSALSFALNLTAASIVIPIPGVSHAPAIIIPPIIYDFPGEITSLPATIARVSSRLSIASILLSLLAVGLIALLIFIWKRRSNILILDVRTHCPYRSLIVYHSRPEIGALWSSVIGDSGRLYIRHLGRYSTLTIRTASVTHILSLSVNQDFYTIEI